MTKFVAMNPKTKKTFIAAAIDKNDFLLTFVKQAPHRGWYPNEVKACVEQDLIEELFA